MTSLLFTVSFPWLICRIRKFIVENTSFGAIKGQFSAKGEQFFKIYLASGLVIAAVVIPTIILVTIVFSSIFTSVKNIQMATYLFAIPTYVGYVLGFAYVKAKSTNLVWGHTQLGPLTFEADLRFRDLFGLYLTNALGIIFSCGFLIPWAVVRTMKYRLDHMQVFAGGDLNQFTGSRQQTVAAVGVEAVDLFDWDLSL